MALLSGKLGLSRQKLYWSEALVDLLAWNPKLVSGPAVDASKKHVQHKQHVLKSSFCESNDSSGFAISFKLGRCYLHHNFKHTRESFKIFPQRFLTVAATKASDATNQRWEIQVAKLRTWRLDWDSRRMIWEDLTFFFAHLFVYLNHIKNVFYFKTWSGVFF